MAAFKTVVNHTSYVVAVVTTLILAAWTVVHTWTKRKDDPHFTDLHMTLSALATTSIVLLLVTWVHANAK
jgi:sugar phosphate permease